MKWQFWILLALSFLLINAMSAGWVAAVLLGGFEVFTGLDVATEGMTLEGLLFEAGCRVVPYAVLTAITLFSSLKYSRPGRVALWVALVAVSIFHSWGYYAFQAPTYTDVRISSTHALMLVFIPLHATWISALFGWTAYRIMKARNRTVVK